VCVHDIGEWDEWLRATYLSALWTVHSIQLVRQIDIVPTDDSIFDQTIAAFGNFLLLFVSLGKFPWISDSDSPCELVGQLNLIELFFNGLAQIHIINVAQDQIGFYDLAERFECLIQFMLF
tara:strand:- start:256 stop:618 length:363 start_codon:yes stop_codon:yes gene_type:complete